MELLTQDRGDEWTAAVVLPAGRVVAGMVRAPTEKAAVAKLRRELAKEIRELEDLVALKRAALARASMCSKIRENRTRRDDV